MQLLLMSDVHDDFYPRPKSDFPGFPPDALPKADICLIAGDITERGIVSERQADELGSWLGALGQRFPVLWIPGNHDFDLGFTTFAHIPNVFCVDGETVTLPNGMTLRGVSLAPCFDLPQLAHQWANMTADPEEDRKAFDFPRVDIVLAHSPPLGILDSAGYNFLPGVGLGPPRHIGSPALLKYIEDYEPYLVVCGHCHEARGRSMHGTTRVINTARTWEITEL